jgi:kojibiose phosphorylase
VYILPFFTFTVPPLARTCLNWRHVGLEPGRQIARDLGYRGAKFAWQAGPQGEECLGRWWRFTHTNIHIDCDVAYALMQYWWASGDDAFMAGPGVDLLVETARFFASRAVYDAKRDAYDIHDVSGPDEGHCESTNNFYTNYLAIWNLRWAVEALEWLRRRGGAEYDACASRLSLDEAEPGKWAEVAGRLTLLLDPETGVYEQYNGYHQLLPAPVLTRDRPVWFATVAPTQGLNQPDVLMAMALFRREFTPEIRRANWLFYKDKSMNFSSMSFVINSIMAADMGDLEGAYEQFRVCAGADVEEDLTGRKDTFAGLHGTAAGGAWMAVVFGFGGVRVDHRGLAIDPNLPPSWNGLAFKLAWRGGLLDVTIDRQSVVVAAGADLPAPVELTLAGRVVTIRPGGSVREARK